MFWYYYRPPPTISSKKRSKKKKPGSATVYTQYIQQKLVTCTCTRLIFYMNEYARKAKSVSCKSILYRYHSVSEFATKIIFTTSARKIYLSV